MPEAVININLRRPAPTSPSHRQARIAQTQRVGQAMESVLEAVATLRGALQAHPRYQSELSVDAAMIPIEDALDEGWQHILS